jgi:hypothetical protein
MTVPAGSTMRDCADADEAARNASAMLDKVRPRFAIDKSCMTTS